MNRSELELPADLEQPALQHTGRPQELVARGRRERRVDGVDEVVVEHVVEIRRLRAAETGRS